MSSGSSGAAARAAIWHPGRGGSENRSHKKDSASQTSPLIARRIRAASLAEMSKPESVRGPRTRRDDGLSRTPRGLRMALNLYASLQHRPDLGFSAGFSTLLRRLPVVGVPSSSKIA